MSSRRDGDMKDPREDRRDDRWTARITEACSTDWGHLQMGYHKHHGSLPLYFIGSLCLPTQYMALVRGSGWKVTVGGTARILSAWNKTERLIIRWSGHGKKYPGTQNPSVPVGSLYSGGARIWQLIRRPYETSVSRSTLPASAGKKNRT